MTSFLCWLRALTESWYTPVFTRSAPIRFPILDDNEVMTRRSAIAGVVLALTAWGKGKEWQEGVLDSFELREIPVKKSVQQYFVYRIRANNNISYMVEFRHPLKAIV